MLSLASLLQGSEPLISCPAHLQGCGRNRAIRKATDATVAAHLAAMRAMKPGVTEREISALLQYEWGKRGCERPAYSPIVGSDSTPPCCITPKIAGTSERRRGGDRCGRRVLDVRSDVRGRCPPMANSRLASARSTTSCWARSRPRSQRSSPASRRLREDDRIPSTKSPTTTSIRTARILHGEPLGKYFIHGLGHCVGLDVHDAQRLHRSTRAGMPSSPSSRASTFLKRSWACASKTVSTWTTQENWSNLERGSPSHRGGGGTCHGGKVEQQEMAQIGRFAFVLIS